MILSIVVTCGRMKLALENNLYTSSPRGAYCLCLCRSEADLVGDRPVISPMKFASPSSLLLGPEPPVSKRNARGIAFGIHVVHRGWALLALIITARGTRSLSWDNAFSSPEGCPHHPNSFQRISSFFLASARIARSIWRNSR